MASTATITHSTNLVVEECCNCGVVFAMSETLYDRCRKQSSAAPGPTRNFYCPNGHEQHYIGRNREQELEEQRDRARNEAATRAAERDQAEASARAHKGAATKARKRAAAAVCPVPGCGRSFVQLRRHMQAKHPEYDPAKA